MKNSELIHDLVDLVPFFGCDHNMRQSGTAVTQYVVAFCYLWKLNQQSHSFSKEIRDKRSYFFNFSRPFKNVSSIRKPIPTILP